MNRKIGFCLIVASLLSAWHVGSAIARSTLSLSWDGDCGSDNRWNACCRDGTGPFKNNFSTGESTAGCPPLPGESDTVDLEDYTVQFGQVAVLIAGLSSTGLLTGGGLPFEVSGSAGLNNFELFRGEFTVGGGLQVDGDLKWGSSGQSSNLHVPLGATVAGGATFEGTLGLHGELTIEGDLSWSSGNLSLYSGSVLTNEGKITISHSPDVLISGFGNRWSIKDQFIKQQDVGQMIVKPQVDLSGSMMIRTGSIRIDNGGNIAGPIQTSEGSSTIFQGIETVNFVSGAALGGNGLYHFVAPIRMNTGSPMSVQNLKKTNGYIDLIGLLNIGKFELQNGSLTSGKFKVDDLLLSSVGVKNVVAAELEISGKGKWENGAIFLEQQGLLINRGEFLMSGNNDFMNAPGGGTIENHGVFKKSGGTGNSRVFSSVVFNNHPSGAIDVGTGALELRGGGLSQGDVKIANGATLRITETPYRFSGTTAVSGGGLMAVQLVGTAKSESGTLTIGRLLVDRFSFLEGPGSIVVSSNFENQGATLRSRASVLSEGQMAMTTSPTQITDHSELITNGTTDWTSSSIGLSGNGRWKNFGTVNATGSQKTVSFSSGGGAIVNETGTINFQTNTNFSGLGLLINEGELNLTNGAAVSFLLNASLQQLGDLNLNSGSLSLQTAFHTFRNSTTNIASGASIVVPSGTLVAGVDSEFRGEGFVSIESAGALETAGFGVRMSKLRLNGSNATVDNLENLTIENELNWIDGLMKGPGECEVLGALNLNGPLFKAISSTKLITRGTTSWNDGYPTLSGGATWENFGTLNILTTVSRDLLSVSGQNNRLLNFGTINHNTPTTTEISGAATLSHDQGAINVNQGKLQIDGKLIAQAPINIEGVLEVGMGELDGLTSAQFSGSGTLRITNGLFRLFSGSPVPVLVHLAGGSQRGVGVNEFTNFRWSGGTLASTFVTDRLVLSGESLIDNPAVKSLSTRTLENRGFMIWDNGSVQMTNDARFINGSAGTMDIGNQTANISLTGSGASDFLNIGTVRKQVGPNSEFVFNVPSSNSGTISAEAGTIRFAQSFSMNIGILRVGPGGLIHFNLPTSINGGIIEGSKVKAARLNMSGGKVSPGQSPGRLTIEGDFELGEAADLVIEIAGLQSGTEHDVLEVTGQAILAGGLEIALLDGFEPEIGDEFQIATFASRQGPFSRIVGAVQSGDIVLRVRYGATDVRLIAMRVGDANGDHCADDSDLALILAAFGATGLNLPEDLNDDGIVDDADLALVLAAFGSGC
ncbi:MAG: hypothetical protein HUU60_11265 [Armatimonadetes bacterium]|nr:hypothetical protein [Armatimonadota bacterium]